MKRNTCSLMRTLPGLILVIVLMAVAIRAQSTTPSTASAGSKSTETTASKKSTEPKKDSKPKSSTDTVPSSATAGDDAGDYKIVSSLEFGYRGIRVDGDQEKFRSDLNLKAGPVLFDSSFLARSKDGKGGFFDTLLVTSTGWGADPYGNLRIDVENPKWYRFEGTYRRFKYYRYLNDFVNPNWLYTPIPVPPNPATGLHGYNTYTHMGDFDLTIMPKNEKIRFNVGYSPERYRGPAFTNYHNGGNDFSLLANLRSQANDYRFGADGTIGPIDWTFVQGFRRFKDDTIIDQASGINQNVSNSVFQLTSFLRQEPTRGSLNYTRLNAHTFIAKKLDITGRYIYSKTTSNSVYLENFTGFNINPRITGWPPTPPSATPNTVNPSFYNIPNTVSRPNTVGDIGMTYLATDKLRISDTFRVEDFTIDGIATFSDFFSVTRGARTDTIAFTNLSANKVTHYRKYQNTIEGDYQITKNYSFHLGYRYGHRRDEQTLTGYELNSNGPRVPVAEQELDTNTTHAVFGGFKARPTKNWTVYFDAEHGTADNVFTRIGNYNYTNVRAKTRFTPNRKLNFNLALIIRNNSNPSEIAGVSLSDFGVDVKLRTFQSSVDWTPNASFSASTGYNYNWVNSDSVIDYYYDNVQHPVGHTLYFMRNNFFFIDTTSRLARRATLFTSYRLNQDGGQGNRLSDPTGNPGTMINALPMNFQTAEGRLALRLNRYLDWNFGYQYYSYNERNIVNIFPASPRAQNYHAHLPYMSLRIYLGRGE
jgi:hypothetical protein